MMDHTDGIDTDIPTASAQHSTVRRLRLIFLVAGLLMAEYFLQSLYYQQQHRLETTNSEGFLLGWFSSPAVVVPKSHAFINQLELETCRFPTYFDKSAFDFKLKDNHFVEPGNWRERNEEYKGLQDAGHVKKFLIQAEQQRARALERNPSLPPITRNLTFVHIGKAGGSTVACNIRWARGYISNHCDNTNYDEIDNYDSETAKRPYIPESAISRHVNCYTHWRMHLACMYLYGDRPFQRIRKVSRTADAIFGSRRNLLVAGNRPKQEAMYFAQRHNDFLVNLRSPLDRIASWFTYEHAENHDVVYTDKRYHCGQLVLATCYRHFEHLTTVGLSGPKPSPSQPLRVGTNLSATECSHWAWAAVRGDMPADYHNTFNYAWYAHRLLDDPLNSQADIFVLRVEHLEQDWTTVDRMLGGDGSYPSSLSSKQNSADIKPLRVPNHNTTDRGLLNLCRALCEEIQVYKLFLLRAVNLREEDLKASMDELRQHCPDEVDIQPRICPTD